MLWCKQFKNHSLQPKKLNTKTKICLFGLFLDFTRRTYSFILKTLPLVKACLPLVKYFSQSFIYKLSLQKIIYEKMYYSHNNHCNAVCFYS